MNPQPSAVRKFFSQLGDEWGLRLFDALPETRFFIKDERGVIIHASRAMHLEHGFAEPSGIMGLTDHDFIDAHLSDQYARDDRKVVA